MNQVNLKASFDDIDTLKSWFGDKMTVPSPTTHDYAFRNHQNSNTAFGAGVVIVLTLLAILSIATGAAPTALPTTFLAP
jgi:hypothetical protein